MKTLWVNISRFLWGPLAISILCAVAMKSPKVPYNVRELFAGGNPMFTILLLVLTIYWLCGVPVILSVWLMNGLWTRIATLPFLIVFHGLIAYGLLRISVPMESIYDIVGSPILKLPWECELIGRFAALFAMPSLMLICGALTALFQYHNSLSINRLYAWRLIAVLAILLILIHWVVVKQAATDNLTELMAGGGSWYSTLLLSGWIFIIASTASIVSAQTVRSNHAFISALILGFSSIIFGYIALRFGTENQIYKYGQHFSAMQFLLSPDRSIFLGEKSIEFRYALSHILAVGIIAVVQRPFWTFIMHYKAQNSIDVIVK